MVHSPRPLEEKMALFWHNHFATAYTKLAGAIGQERATRAMDNDPSEPGGQPAGTDPDVPRSTPPATSATCCWRCRKTPAMIYWLDMQLNTRTRPQENFGREIMELFSLGIGNYTEQDVYAAARVFTGFNWQVIGDRADVNNSYYTFHLPPDDHDVNAKEFTFAIYPDGGRVIPARAAAAGEQDAVDFIAALARHPATARRLATRLYKFFVNETAEPDAADDQRDGATRTCPSNYNIKPMLRTLFKSSAVPQPEQLLPALFLAGRVRGARHQGNRVATATR